MRLLSIDPGLAVTGWATWTAQGRLFEADFIKGLPSSSSMCVRLDYIISALPQDYDTVVVEMPEVYSTKAASKGDANDLMKLAVLVGGIVYGKTRLNSITETPLPKEWKGQVKKPVTKARCQRDLSIIEKRAVPKGAPFDTWDAIGLGLWYLKKNKLR